MDRIDVTVAACAMSMVLPATESLSHDWHPVRNLRGKAQSTDMTTNKNLSSSGQRAAAKESQIKAAGSSTLPAAESLRSPELLPLGIQQLSALAAVYNYSPARTQQLQLFLSREEVKQEATCDTRWLSAK